MFEYLKIRPCLLQTNSRKSRGFRERNLRRAAKIFPVRTFYDDSLLLNSLNRHFELFRGTFFNISFHTKSNKEKTKYFQSTRAPREACIRFIPLSPSLSIVIVPVIICTGMIDIICFTSRQQILCLTIKKKRSCLGKKTIIPTLSAVVIHRRLSN